MAVTAAWRSCLAGLLLVVGAAGGGVSAQTAGGETPSLRVRMLAAEDARAGTADEQRPLFEGLKSGDAELRRIGVRAMGRLEQPGLVPAIAPVLDDESPLVRAEAANAIVQAAGSEGASRAAGPLVKRLDRENDAVARGAMLRALGRIPYSTVEQLAEAERRLAGALTSVAGGTPSPLVLLGALRGMESLARLHSKTRPLSPAVATLLASIAEGQSGGEGATPVAALARRLALMSLIAGGQATEATVGRALADPDEQVRRLGATAVAAILSLPTAQLAPLAAQDPANRGGRDPSPMVRYEALRALARRQALSCPTALAAAIDPAIEVALLAVDSLPDACRDNEASTARLEKLAGELTVEGKGWHRGAHALIALARSTPNDARPHVVGAAAHHTWQVRMYAARAAVVAGDLTVLERLARDDHDNVREAALAGMASLAGHGADAYYIAALARPDPQLLIRAAKALEGSPQREKAVEALLAALDRVTAGRRETSRDARRALLERLAELGGPAQGDRIRPYLRDFDPTIATQAADVLAKWTGAPVRPDPQPLPREALPTETDLQRLAGASVVVTLGGGASFDVRLLASEAPLNAWRFARLAENGYYTGLTVHRIVPNFVIQGGSPGANEYAGAGPFSRDEVGLQSNLRGTVGLSTRGRDTGDAQFYVNLVDNVRLDHTYTVFGQITRGLDVVDTIAEGEHIERVRVVWGEAAGAASR